MIRVSPDRGVIVELTNRQAEIIELYADGLPTKMIAQCLRVSPKTVEFHRAQIYMKLKVNNLVRLTKWAIRAGLSGLACVAIAAAAQVPFLAPTNPAPEVQLAWTPSASTGITNYFMYLGVGSGQYTNKIALGNVTNATVTLPSRGVPFFFAVTAMASNGLESVFSNEITYTAPNPPAPPAMKPLVVLVVQSSPTSTGAFADAGMNWSLPPDAPEQFYKLRMQKGMVLSLAAPPMPTK
jgi:DNA-binding CsgD family transcriptional regulator